MLVQEKLQQQQQQQQQQPMTADPATPTSSTVAVAAASATTIAQQGQKPLKPLLLHEQRSVLIRSATMNPQSPAPRPEDLRVKPWYATAVEEERDSRSSSTMASKDQSPPDQSSYPVYQQQQSYELDGGVGSSSNILVNHNDVPTSARGVDALSTRTSSIESEANNHHRSTVPRKAYMDLNDAMALLDETCPNPDVSPQMTPRTPLTPHPRNKRARSKSSDNSSNYSSEKLNERPEREGPKEKDRMRPFLKKIGISMTEDRPLLAKLAPRIMGKPYLEKIGPSRAVDKPFLEKIGSSRTLDKFTFDTPRRKEIENNNNSSRTTIPEEPEKKSPIEMREQIRGFSTGERRRSGKNFLLKMYSFETEDLEDAPTLAMKAPHRDPLRGASLDDVLESGPSSMPRINETTPSASAAELVRCRVTTSEEIISSNSCLNSPMDLNNWVGSSPAKRRTDQTAKNNDSVPNSPTKRTHSITPEKVTAVYRDLEKVKGGRQSSDEILDKRKSRFDQFETRSSDNLAKERVATPVFAEIGSKNINGKGSSSSVMSSTSSTRQFDRFDSQELFKESYVEFKLRTQGNCNNALKRLIVREKTISPSFDLGFSSKEAMIEKMKSEGSPKMRSKSAETERPKLPEPSSKDKLETANNQRRLRNRSVLRKQQGIEHANYQPSEPSEPSTNQHRKMVHEPSQETLDLLTQLQKVKSQLKTPSIEKDELENKAGELKPFPKRILLTDEEFCLSIERENSIRRPSRVNTLEKKPEQQSRAQSTEISVRSPEKKIKSDKDSENTSFEKRCLSLDCEADKSSASKTEPRTISLTVQPRSPRYSDELGVGGLMTSDSKSYSSDVFNSPDEAGDKSVIEKEVKPKVEAVTRNNKQQQQRSRDRSKSPRVPTDSSSDDKKETSEQQVSPQKKKSSSDSFEATPSPKATPFRMKKRLGRISVEETVKQESFTVNKVVECKEVAVQKKAKCLPL